MQILFVCTGNTCRSPLAEVIARRILDERNMGYVHVASAGTNAWADAPASDGSLLVAMENAMDLSKHRAQQLSPELVAASSLILTMGPHHLERAEALGGAGKSWLLTGYVNGAENAWAVTDPFGGDLNGYRETYAELDREIHRIIEKVAVHFPDPAA